MYLHYRAAASPSNGALNAGAIAGIVLGVVVSALVLAAGLWKCFIRLRKNRFTTKAPISTVSRLADSSSIPTWSYPPKSTFPADMLVIDEREREIVAELATYEEEVRKEGHATRFQDRYLIEVWGHSDAGNTCQHPQVVTASPLVEDQSDTPPSNRITSTMMLPPDLDAPESLVSTLRENSRGTVPQGGLSSVYEQSRGPKSVETDPNEQERRLYDRYFLRGIPPIIPRCCDGYSASDLEMLVSCYARNSATNQKDPSDLSQPLPEVDLSDCPWEGAIDPWELEYKPNPVIFAHLADYADFMRIEKSHNQEIHGPNSSGDMKLDLEDSTRSAALHERNGSKVLLKNKRFYESEKLPTKGSRPSKRKANSLRMTRGTDPSFPVGLTCPRSISPVAITQPAQDCLDSSPQATLLAIAPSKLNHLAPEWDADSSSPSDSASGTISTPAFSVPPDGDLPFPCTECEQRYRTLGQRTEHMNRKHVRRFQCSVCEKAFNLQADLKRHKNNVHKIAQKQSIDVEDDVRLTCPNDECKSKDKVWGRKDNFTRHVERCRRWCGERLRAAVAG
jgi:hypothetical protein